MSSMKCTGECCPIPELTKGATICTANKCKFRTDAEIPDKTCNNCACDRICDHNVNGFEICGNWIDKAVLEPEKRGHWIIHTDGGCNNWCECSECNTIGSPQWKRCPICEAKMEPLRESDVNRIETGTVKRVEIDQFKNEQLKLDDLRKMDGAPVWVVVDEEEKKTTLGFEPLSFWTLVEVTDESIVLTNNLGGRTEYAASVEFEDDGITVYRHKPKDVRL